MVQLPAFAHLHDDVISVLVLKERLQAHHVGVRAGNLEHVHLFHHLRTMGEGAPDGVGGGGELLYYMKWVPVLISQ